MLKVVPTKIMTILKLLILIFVMYFFFLIIIIIEIIIEFYIFDYPHIHNKLKTDISLVIFTLIYFYLEL